ncbi:MAG: hypothetical protein ACLR07_04385 [Christensenellales bacterium]
MVWPCADADAGHADCLEDFDARTWRTSFLILTALTALLTVPFMLPENWLNQLGRVGEILLNRRTGAYASAVFRVFSLSAALLGGGAMLFILCEKPRFAVTLALTCAVAVTQYAGYIAVSDANLLSGGETVGDGMYTLSEIAEPTLQAVETPDMDIWQRIDYGKIIRNYGLLRGASSLTAFTSLRPRPSGALCRWRASVTTNPPPSARRMAARRFALF